MNIKQKEYQARWYQKHRAEHIERTAQRRRIYKMQNGLMLRNYLKDHPCKKCGFSNPAALEFHHTKDKKMEISNLVMGGYPPRVVLEEISKCIVLCANCHRILTAKEQGWSKALA